MRVSFPAVLTAGVLLVSLTTSASARTHRVARSAHANIRHNSSSRHAIVRHEAPAGMATERATEIQQALIKNGYLSGEPTGRWDAESAAAMQKLQADNGWQTKITPDSRALIKLGLGPGAAQSTPQ